MSKSMNRIGEGNKAHTNTLVKTALAAEGDPPDITLAHYDNQVLYLNWTNPGAYTDFIVGLRDTSGSIHYNQPAAGTSAAIDKALEPDKTYMVSVGAIIDGKPGPRSSEVTLIVIPPVLSLLQYSLESGRGKLDASWGAVTGAELYVTSVYAADGSFKQNIPSATTSSTLASTLDQAKQYKATVCATAGNGTVIGPASPGLAAIIACPGQVNLHYNGQNLRSDWIIPASLRGKRFNCQLCRDGARLAEQVTGESQASFGYTLEAGAIYTARVRGEEGAVKGPWTEPAQGPYAENTVFDYDPVGRLQSITCHTTTITYTMDAPGNIISIQNNQV